MSVPAFLDAIGEWCRGERDVAAVVLVGSHARGTATAASDVDLVILTSDPEAYVADENWPRRFGVVARRAVEDWGLVTSVRVWFEAGLEVEFGFTTAAWAARPLDAGTREVLSGGYRVLFDRDALFDFSAES